MTNNPTDILTLCREVLACDAVLRNDDGSDSDYAVAHRCLRTAAPVLAREVARVAAERDALRAEVALLEERLDNIEH